MNKVRKATGPYSKILAITLEIIRNEQQVDILSIIGSNMSKESTRKRKMIDFQNNCLFKLKFLFKKIIHFRIF